MPDNPDNTGAQDLPEKYKGKTIAEIAKMHQEAEELLGRQGSELGTLRGSVTRLSTLLEEKTKPAAAEESPSKARYRRFGEKLILDPDNALPELVEEIKKDVRSEVSRDTEARLTSQQQVAAFLEANPELKDYPEVVYVIGDYVWRQNPNRPMTDILAETKKQANAWLGTVRDRLDKNKKEERARRVAGMTTGGGSAREGAELGSEKPEGEEGLSPEDAAIKAELENLKASRAAKLFPPRSAVPKK